MINHDVKKRIYYSLTFVIQESYVLAAPFNDDDEYEFLGFTAEQIEAARLREEMKKMEYMQEREKDRHYFKPGRPHSQPGA